MDTKTLVVGQDVYICSIGVYIQKGKVVKITSSGVDVQTDNGLFHFDKDGKECNRNEAYGLPEWGPEWSLWELDDMPFMERTAFMEQAARDYEARRSEANRRPPR